MLPPNALCGRCSSASRKETLRTKFCIGHILVFWILTLNAMVKSGLCCSVGGGSHFHMADCWNWIADHLVNGCGPPSRRTHTHFILSLSDLFLHLIWLDSIRFPPRDLAWMHVEGVWTSEIRNVDIVKGGVLLGLPHVMPAQSPQAYGGILPSRNCLTGVNCSPLLVARHLSRSQDSFCPSHLPSVYGNHHKYTDTLPPYKGSRMGSIWRYGLRPQRQVTRHGQTIYTFLISLDWVRSPIKPQFKWAAKDSTVRQRFLTDSATFFSAPIDYSLRLRI